MGVPSTHCVGVSPAFIFVDRLCITLANTQLQQCNVTVYMCFLTAWAVASIDEFVDGLCTHQQPHANHANKEEQVTVWECPHRVGVSPASMNLSTASATTPRPTRCLRSSSRCASSSAA